MTKTLHSSFGLPRDVKEYIQVTFDHGRGKESLVPLIQRVYGDLRQYQDFKRLVDAACSFTPSDEKPVFHHALAENDRYRLSLIGIHRFFPFPVHDHHQATGVQFVIHGRLQVRSFQLLETVREPSLVRLECLADNILGAGSTSITEKTVSNLHGLQSMTVTAVCLSLQVPPCLPHQQAWYFPTNPLADHTQATTWNRVIKSPGNFVAQHHRFPQHELEGLGS